MGELYQIVEKKDSKQLAEHLSHNGHALLPRQGGALATRGEPCMRTYILHYL